MSTMHDKWKKDTTFLAYSITSINGLISRRLGLSFNRVQSSKYFWELGQSRLSLSFISMFSIVTRNTNCIVINQVSSVVVTTIFVELQKCKHGDISLALEFLITGTVSCLYLLTPFHQAASTEVLIYRGWWPWIVEFLGCDTCTLVVWKVAVHNDRDKLFRYGFHINCQPTYVTGGFQLQLVEDLYSQSFKNLVTFYSLFGIHNQSMPVWMRSVVEVEDFVVLLLQLFNTTDPRPQDLTHSKKHCEWRVLTQMRSSKLVFKLIHKWKRSQCLTIGERTGVEQICTPLFLGITYLVFVVC